MPAAVVIPAPIVYIKVVAVKKLVVELQAWLGGLLNGMYCQFVVTSHFFCQFLVICQIAIIQNIRHLYMYGKPLPNLYTSHNRHYNCHHHSLLPHHTTTATSPTNTTTIMANPLLGDFF